MKKALMDLLRKHWKDIAWKVWEAVDEKIQEKVKSSESKWDDMAYNAANILAEKFLKPEQTEKK